MSNALLVDAALRAPSRLTAPFPTGRWWDFACWAASSTGSTAISANIIYAQKLKIPRGIVIAGLFAETTVAAAAGKLIRLGLYTVGSNGLPDQLIVDSGSLAADAVAGEIAYAVSRVLPYDEVWAAALSDGAPTLRAYVTTNTPNFAGWSSATTTTKDIAVTKNQAYGALPASFGAITGYGTVPLRVGVKS